MGLQGEEDNSQEDVKSRCLGSKCLPCHVDICLSDKNEGLGVRALFLVQVSYLHSFRQVRER